MAVDHFEISIIIINFFSFFRFCPNCDNVFDLLNTVWIFFSDPALVTCLDASFFNKYCLYFIYISNLYKSFFL